MGVPAFFRWLSRKYGSIVVDAVEEKNRDVNEVKVPVNCTEPNPNYQEFDNLYLDMNGIIHPCTHPEDRPAPKTEDEMFVLIFEYIDRLFSIVRPRRILYMAIDGVAPRAKMNQQRSRRFRAAKEATEKQEQILSVRRKLASEGIPLPPQKKEEEHFDSNCITPGTPFMDRLAVALRYYVHKKISTDAAWQSIQVILSDANAPGEGEHKIMDFIRRQRSLPTHDPNTVHCLCGADADLIMLGLATHEANFNILREEFVPNQPRACELCGQYGHELDNCQGLARDEAGPDQVDPLKKEKNFIFIRLPVLREFLERELAMPNLPFPYDFERAVDDWVFMCFFVGNDFLPHLPSLEIRENAIDRLIKLYKDVVYKTQGWLTDSGEVYIDRVEIIMVELGKAEDEIFKTRQIKELRYRKNNKRNQQQNAGGGFSYPNYKHTAPLRNADPYISQIKNTDDSLQRCEEASERLKAILLPVGSKRPASADILPQEEPPVKSFKEVMTNEKNESDDKRNDDCMDDEPHDEIRLHEAGWKERYYQSKFGVSESDAEFRNKVAWAYTEGLCWVLKYYYQGCASWNWYFPYHYAPFASDFNTIGQFKPDFSKPTQPFKPLEQLMGVFPAASKLHIPEGWRSLMTDTDSPIYDFYPNEFDIDLNGKKFAWQGVALLPFVDEKRLLLALENVYSTLTEEELRRNCTGLDRLFVGKQHPIFESFYDVYKAGKVVNFEKKKNEKNEVNHDWVYINTTLTNGMAGEVSWDTDAVEPGETFPSLFCNSLDWTDVEPNSCIMVLYRDPQYPIGYNFEACRLPGITELEKVLKPYNYDSRQSGTFQPQIGFTRNIPRANVSSAGHRFLNHAVHNNDSAANRDYQPLSRSFPTHQRGRYNAVNVGYNGNHQNNQSSQNLQRHYNPSQTSTQYYPNVPQHQYQHQRYNGNQNFPHIYCPQQNQHHNYGHPPHDASHQQNNEQSRTNNNQNWNRNNSNLGRGSRGQRPNSWNRKSNR